MKFHAVTWRLPIYTHTNSIHQKAGANWKSGEKANSNVLHANSRKFDSIQQCKSSAALVATLK
jgi:hypothetical protein